MQIWTRSSHFGKSNTIKSLILTFSHFNCPRFQHREQWRQEVAIMLRLDHLNVVQCRPPPDQLAQFLDDGGQMPMLCMEFCSGGDLRKTLNEAQSCVGLDNATVLDCVTDIASALGN